MWLTKSKKTFCLVLCLLLLWAPVFSADTSQGNMQSQQQTVAELLQSMKTDLQLLELSIANYKKQISELRSIITESQNDLEKQKQLLTESMDNLKKTEIQYSELSETFQNLNKQYQSSLKTGRLKNKIIIGLGAGLAASIIINVLK